MASAVAPAVFAQGHEVVGIHRVDNDDTVAAAAAKGIQRTGMVTRWCLPGRAWFSHSRPSRAAGVGARHRPGRHAGDRHRAADGSWLDGAIAKIERGERHALPPGLNLLAGL
jgi:hypothetical protein